MHTTRRDFLRLAGAAGVAVAGRAEAASPHASADHAVGVLVDIPKCIGCRLCEHACQDSHGFAPPPVKTFEDKRVFEQIRRPQPRSYTVVNRYPNPQNPAKPIYTKFNCLHCLDPSCVSACLVGALRKEPAGQVLYNKSKCMGCRYCMVACPFEMPAYEYDEPLKPHVRKCDLCVHLVPSKQGVPACVKICPAEALTYGRRDQLLEIAHEKTHARSGYYVDHVYGEHEAGGTSWLYLSSVPHAQAGFWPVDSTAPPRLTEAIQHGLFKKFGPPAMLYGLLAAIMWLSRAEDTPATVETLGGVHGRTSPGEAQE